MIISLVRLFVSSVNASVVNANHDRVTAVVDKFLIDRYRNVCTCPRCMSDIVAIALNYLPPHYIVERGAEKQYGSPWVMVETAVADAIDRVMENPNHPRTNSHSAQAEITAQEF
jgi:competence protein ComFB